VKHLYLEPYQDPNSYDRRSVRFFSKLQRGLRLPVSKEKFNEIRNKIIYRRSFRMDAAQLLGHKIRARCCRDRESEAKVAKMRQGLARVSRDLDVVRILKQLKVLKALSRFVLKAHQRKLVF
jgi:hypothetical protein